MEGLKNLFESPALPRRPRMPVPLSGHHQDGGISHRLQAVIATE